MAESAVKRPPIAAGTAIGDYVIEERIGQGSEGEVYLARDVLLGRRVAIKTLRAGTAELTHGVEEARLMAGLEHPHVVRVYHAQRHRGIWAVVFEYTDGGSLQSLVQRMGPLRPPRALELLAQAASGLACVHENQIVHRDVKPHNLLLTRHGEVKLADFGLALAMRLDCPAAKAAVGTPAFLAPELWRNGTCSPASDIYSLGACLYFLLTGRVPFPFHHLDQLERAHLELKAKIPSDIPRGVREMVLAMLAKSPAARPASDQALSRELFELSRDPYRPRRASLPAKARDIPSPFAPGAIERALHVSLSRGLDAAVVERLATLLAEEVASILLFENHAGDADGFLRVAIERCHPRPSIVAHVKLSTSDASLSSLLRKRSNVSPMASLGEALDQLPSVGADGAGGRRLIEIRVTCPLDTAQKLELEALRAEAARQGIGTVLIGRAVAMAAAAAPGMGIVELPAADVPWLDFVERMKLWTIAATEERWDFSVDALRLVRHSCREHGHSWRELAQGSVSMAAAARLPVVTTWAVRQAELQMTGRLASSEPGQWAAAPRRWPTSELLELLARLRTELERELEGEGRQLAAMSPTRVAYAPTVP
jgi:serine/threonine protein kinase